MRRLPNAVARAITSPLSARAVLVAALAFGCDRAAGPSAPRVVTLEVAPHRIPCVALEPTHCLLVRELPSATWQWWHDPIDGFTHEEGFAYRLRVARSAVQHPPADGSSFAYTLLAVLEKTPAP